MILLLLKLQVWRSHKGSIVQKGLNMVVMRKPMTESPTDRLTDRPTDTDAPVSRPNRVDQVVESKDGRRSRRFSLRDLVRSFLPDEKGAPKW